MAVVPPAVRIGFRNLGIQGRRETGHELADQALDLDGIAPGGINHHPEEKVGHDVDTLGIAEVGSRPEEIPPGEPGHFPEGRPVEDQPRPAFLEASAIQGVDSAHDEGDRQHQDRISLQLVEGGNVQEQGDAQFQDCLDYADIGEGVHMLVGHDNGVERDAHQVHDQRQHRTLHDPVCGSQAVRRDVVPGIQEPESHRFDEEEDDPREDQFDHDARREDLPEVDRLPRLPLAEAEGQETADRRGQGIRHDREHHHDAAHGIVDADVGDAERMQDHPGGEEADQHQQEHPEIQENRIPGDPPAACRYVRVLFHHPPILTNPIPQFRAKASSESVSPTITHRSGSMSGQSRRAASKRPVRGFRDGSSSATAVET